MFPGLAFPGTNPGRGFKPVHLRHLHIHEDKIELPLFQRADCLQSVGSERYGVSCLSRKRRATC